MHWLAAGSAIAALFAAGALYQSLGELCDRWRFRVGVDRVVIDSGQWIYMCQRGKLRPTIVFEAGIGATSQNWHALQETFAGVAGTVTYDRGGLGWSSGGRWSKRTPGNIARELHAMLLAAQIAPPYLLVGHSFGGVVVRRFVAQYPDEVCGVVLVDPMRPEEWPPLNLDAQSQLDRYIRLLRLGVPLARVGVARLVATSLLRRSGRMANTVSRVAGDGGTQLLGRLTAGLDKLPRKVWPVVAAHWSSPHFYRGMVAHLRAVPATVREMENTPPIDHVPVTVLTQSSIEPLSAEALRRIGADTQQIVAEHSGHWVHLDEPELVREVILAMLEAAKTNAEDAKDAEVR